MKSGAAALFPCAVTRTVIMPGIFFAIAVVIGAIVFGSPGRKFVRRRKRVGRAVKPDLIKAADSDTK